MLVNSNFNKNDDKYALKTEIPTSLPANGGNADTVDGYHIRCEDVATPNYNWFATFDNDGLSGKGRVTAVMWILSMGYMLQIL